MSNIKKTILLIEDDPDQQKMYSLVFTKKGYKFLQALGGVEGVEMAQREKPALILLDILMNGINGIETLELLKKDDIIKDIPVIILTNYTREETLKKALALGAKEIIVKTDIVPHELVKLIQNKYLNAN
jgi:CheY-like chemotaxis protein